VRLFVNGVLQAVKKSAGTQCPSDFPPTPQ
jgi:hypothetical protein